MTTISSIFDRRSLFGRFRHCLMWLKREITGLASDFWKDGNWEPPRPRDDDNDLSDLGSSARARDPSLDGFWHPAPGELAEKMWGEGYVLPGEELITDSLVNPLGLTKEMAFLDLSAGLGTRLRDIARKTGAKVMGLERDLACAARGRTLSVKAGLGATVDIAPYDPATLSLPFQYDCVVMRELVSQADDKDQFIAAVAKCCKPKTRVSFTDYIVNPETRDHPAIAAWQRHEPKVTPVGLVEMAELWSKTGINLRDHDDMTALYRREVKAGLVRLSDVIGSGVKIDGDTKREISACLAIWAHRLMALDAGMKFYRFYGLR